MGYGRVGKHRKHESGRGNAGGQHHHRTLFDKFHPGYFGKVGMRTFHHTDNRHYCPSININSLWNLLPKDAQAKAVADKKLAPVLDVTKFGFHKVLGSGELPAGQPIIVKAKFFTGTPSTTATGDSRPPFFSCLTDLFLSAVRAEQKIRASGGAVELTC
jgi:large subunit ribosomal protein L27Ae